MAARRLLVVMIVLLVLSSLAAALIPPPPHSSTTSTTSTSTTTHTTPAPAEPAEQPGSQVRRTVSVAAKKPRDLVLQQNDQLALTVSSPRFTQVEIRGLGLVDDAQPGTPASFNILLAEPGSYPVRAIDAKRTVAVIKVRGAGSRRGSQGRSGGPAPAGSPRTAA